MLIVHSLEEKPNQSLWFGSLPPFRSGSTLSLLALVAQQDNWQLTFSIRSGENSARIQGIIECLISPTSPVSSGIVSKSHLSASVNRGWWPMLTLLHHKDCYYWQMEDKDFHPLASRILAHRARAEFFLANSRNWSVVNSLQIIYFAASIDSLLWSTVQSPHED